MASVGVMMAFTGLSDVCEGNDVVGEDVRVDEDVEAGPVDAACRLPWDLPLSAASLGAVRTSVGFL